MRIKTNDLTLLIDKGDPLSLICVDVEQQKLFSAENLKNVLFRGTRLPRNATCADWSANELMVF